MKPAIAAAGSAGSPAVGGRPTEVAPSSRPGQSHPRSARSGDLARRVAGAVPDPEIPVLSIEDLGILRDVELDDHGHVHVTITPTYSGCPAMRVIERDIEHALLARERWQQVLKAVATLPDRQRLVFTLSHLDERTAAEISEATGMSPATVRVHLFRAIRRLRQLLERER